MIYTHSKMPDHPHANHWGFVRDHIKIACDALGESLPLGAVVHHHTKDQLVLCQDDAYHKLIHRRTRAYEACGHADWRKCPFCKIWDDPANMYVLDVKEQGARHRACYAKYMRDRRKKLKYRRIENGRF